MKREFEKNFWGSRKLPQAPENVCDENERKKKIDCRVKILWRQEGIYKAVSEEWLNRFLLTSGY